MKLEAEVSVIDFSIIMLKMHVNMHEERSRNNYSLFGIQGEFLNGDNVAEICKIV